jgi:predicted RNase H-like HicB family nuclease
MGVSEGNTMDHYTVVIWWSERDKRFLAEIEELEGCIADGRTQEESLRALQETKDLWMRTAREDGWEIPAPRAHRQEVDVAA